MADDNQPFGGNAAVPGNLGAMTPQMMSLYLQTMRDRTKQRWQPSHSWADIPGGILEGLAENKERDQLMKAIGGMSGGAPGDTVPQLPSDSAPAAPNNTGSGAIPDGFKSDQHSETGYGVTNAGDDPALVPAMTLSAKGETGAASPKTLGNISPDTGGSKSYGWWGVNSRSGSAAEFAKAHPELGLTATPGTPEFDQQWKDVAAKNPQALTAAHGHYYVDRILGGADKDLQGVDPTIAQDPRTRIYMADRRLQKGDVGLQRDLKAAKGATDAPSFLKTMADSERANIGKDFRTYLKANPGNVQGLDNRVGLRYGGAMNFKPAAAGAGAPVGGPSTVPGTPPSPTSAPSPAPQGGQGSAYAQAPPAGAVPSPAGNGAGAAGAPFQSPTAAPGAGPAQKLPPMPGSREAFARDQQQVQQLLRYPVGSPERQRGEQLAADLQKRLEPSAYTDPRTGQIYYGTDVGGRVLAQGQPRALMPGEAKGAEAVSEELGKAQVKPVGEAIERGNTAQKEEQLLTTMSMLSKMTPQALQGPLAEPFMKLGQTLNEISGGTLGWSTAGAEATQKLNYALASLAAREITNRPALAEFRSMITSNPGLANSPEGRDTLIDILRQQTRQDIEIAKYASKTDSPRTFADWRDQYIASHPITVKYKGQNYDPTPEGMQRLQQDFAGPGPEATAPPPANPYGGNASSMVGALRGAPAGGGPDMARVLGTTNPIAQALAAGDNPQAAMTPAESASHAAIVGAPAAAGAMMMPGVAPLVAKLGWSTVKKLADYGLLSEILKLNSGH